MIRSLVFTTQGRLHSKNIEMFLMPTLLTDTNLFLWVDLENPTPEETQYVSEDVCVKATVHIARAPDRVAHTLLDSIAENYKPALDEFSLEIAELEQEALQNPSTDTLNKLLRVKKEVLHLRQIIGPQREVLAR